jgi:hypothetical protein
LSWPWSALKKRRERNFLTTSKQVKSDQAQPWAAPHKC